LPARHKAERPPIAHLLRFHRAQRQRAAAADHRDRDRLAFRLADQLRDGVEVRRRHAVDRDDLVAGLQTDVRSRCPFFDGFHGAVRVAGDADHVGERDQQHREHDVHPGAGEDHCDALPRALTPVRIRAQSVVELCERASGELLRPGRELGLVDCLDELRERHASGDVIPNFECALDARDLWKEAWVFFERGAQLYLDVRRRRAVHSRDLHVAAERDRPDPILDAVAHDLDESRRKADVETAWSHADSPRDVEVAGLVQQDQNRQAEDCDKDVHRPLVGR
jgi:hypothetical protein